MAVIGGESDSRNSGTGKSREAFRTISEVADALDLPQHVLRFWETKFNQIRPLKRGGNRRYYRPEDVVVLRAIKTLLHERGYTIKGVQKLFRQEGLKGTIAYALEGAPTDGVAVASNGNGHGDRAGQAHGEAAGARDTLTSVLADLRTMRRMLDGE